ncbi:MAG: hypothetical protein E6Q98_05450 [Rhodospirillaceae bacterium]|nr:MAG: hypothetical protein E6Q98_05450 [Rhodospirillaceae bacterium]
MMSLQAMPENTSLETTRRVAPPPAGDRHGSLFQGEVTLDDLMSDPVMPVLWQADHLTEGDVWRLIREVAARLRRPNPR